MSTQDALYRLFLEIAAPLSGGGDPLRMISAGLLVDAAAVRDRTARLVVSLPAAAAGYAAGDVGSGAVLSAALQESESARVEVERVAAAAAVLSAVGAAPAAAALPAPGSAPAVAALPAPGSAPAAAGLPVAGAAPSAGAAVASLAPGALAGLLVEAQQSQDETQRLATAVLAAAADKAARVASGSGAGSSSGSGSAAGSASTAPSVFDKILPYLPISPLVAIGHEIASLFGLGYDPLPAPLVKYALPQSIEFQGIEQPGGAVSSVDYDQSGRPRAYGSGGGAPGGAGLGPVSPAAAVDGGRLALGADVVEVSAVAASDVGPSAGPGSFDPRYFLDHQDAIASAVREALLNSHALADVINDL